MSSYINTIRSLDEEIKRLNAHLKTLRIQRDENKRLLKEFMEMHDYTDYEGVSINSLVRKQRKPRKKKKEKEEDGIKLLMEIGVPNPKEFYEQFRKSQV